MWEHPKPAEIFSNSDTAKPEALVVGKPADPITRNTRKRARKFSREDVEAQHITVVSEVLPGRF